MLVFDHLVVSATALDQGVAEVEAALGLRLQGGGQHVKMGTHNRLLHLGDIYLEVIARNPDLPRPDRPLWFDLDCFTGPARPTVWVTRTEDLEADLAASPPGIGTPIPMERNGFSWTVVVPDSGILPFDNSCPALIQWDEGSPHPVDRLIDIGVRLARLEVQTPHAAALAGALQGRFHDPRVVIVAGPETAMRATFSTPHGLRVL